MKKLTILMITLLILPTSSFANEKLEKVETTETLSAAIFSERIPKEKYEGMISKYAKSLLDKSNINIPCEEVQKQFDDDMLSYVSKSFSFDSFINFVSSNMSNNFTVDELKVILAFYKTDAGKKVSRFDNGFKMMTSQQIHGYIKRSYSGLTPIYTKYADTKKMCKLIENNKKK